MPGHVQQTFNLQLGEKRLLFSSYKKEVSCVKIGELALSFSVN